jgi:GTP pyrophosphokinase
MKDIERIELEGLALAPYIQKATALIGKERKVGGNQFRHAIATLAILIDYHVTDPVILKAAVIHDLLEDVPETDIREIESVDEDGRQVAQLVQEVSRGDEPKTAYLARVRDSGSRRAKILKVADRLSNVTDLHLCAFSEDFVRKYIDETEKYIYPIATEINGNMATELRDLLDIRRRSLEQGGRWPKRTSNP